ncbi:sigma-70 family RNA polymerase sigma factor [Henriciella barbarensis]|uniref:sigma-70 family RNA polymerase sigma factor n=1 Tax=Henriciella barbarensis TaxID=86342 RepID=UPI0015FD16FB
MTASWVATLGAVARRYAGRPDEADDLFQSACLAILDLRIHPSPALRPWLRQVRGIS